MLCVYSDGGGEAKKNNTLPANGLIAIRDAKTGQKEDQCNHLKLEHYGLIAMDRRNSYGVQAIKSALCSWNRLFRGTRYLRVCLRTLPFNV